MSRLPRPEFTFSEESQIDVASAVVLLQANRRDAAGAIRCALAGLGLVGVIRTQRGDAGSGFAIRDVPAGIVLPPPLRAVHTAMQLVGSADKVWTRRELRLSLQSEFGVGYRRFIRANVYPWLIEKGLLAEEETQVFSIIPATRFQPTAQGKTAQARLRSLRTSAEQLPSLLQRDARAAVTSLIELGPGFLLANNLRADYRALGQALSVHADALDIKALWKASTAQRSIWVDALNPPRIADHRNHVDRLDAALAAADFIDNGD
jgi:hypothetical protein